MGRCIKIDYYQVELMGKKFYDEAQFVKKLIDDLKNDFNSLDVNWVGDDSHNFVVKGLDFTDELQKEYYHLLKLSEYLTKAALRYAGNMEDSVKRLRDIERILSGVEDEEMMMGV